MLTLSFYIHVTHNGISSDLIHCDIFALKFNIYLQNIYRTCMFVGFCLTASLIMHVSISEHTCAMTLMFTLQHEFELSTHPSIPSNGHVGGLCYSCFNIIHQNFFPVSFSSRIILASRATVCRFSIGRHFCRADRKLCLRWFS